jgi:hypothetical protein
MTVYIPQVMDYNVRSAEKFGKLKVMLPDRKQMILSSGPLTFELQKELKDFNDNDYLLLIGDLFSLQLHQILITENLKF